jgi:gluconolactonase
MKSSLLAALLVAAGCSTAAPPEPDQQPAAPRATLGTVTRVDPRFDTLVPADAKLEVLAEGFEWTEGPVWVPSGGYLLFSDIPNNTVFKWKEDEGLRVFMRPAGYSGPEPPGDELGTNGLLLDAAGNLVVCDHGNRMVAQVDTVKFTRTPLADRYQGKRLNSPNDAVFKSNGDLYFTDPPYGLRGLNESPAKEIAFNGVYRRTPDGTVTVLVDTLTFPNGIAFSPDEQTLYVAISDERPYWAAYDVQADGTLANGRVFFDGARLQAEGKHGSADGLKVDAQGNLFATGPGGVVVFSPDGTHLGTIETGQATANCAFGDDGSTLYVTADMYLARIRLTTKGKGF